MPAKVPVRSSVDPSRTTMLRRRLASEFRRRFIGLDADIKSLLLVEDVMGLVPRPAFNSRWSYLPDSQKVAQFDQWLNDMIQNQILATTGFLDSIEKAYIKGAERSFRDVNRGEFAVASSEEIIKGRQLEFFRSNLPQILITDKVRVLTDRVLTDLKGVTDAMSVQIRRELVDGLIKRSGPKEIAKRISDRVEKIGIARAELIARTEIVRAHAEGQLDAMEKLDVEEVTIMMEWVALYDACPLCQAQAIDGPYTLQDAHGLIPFHPACRCAWFPYRVRGRG